MLVCHIFSGLYMKPGTLLKGLNHNQNGCNILFLVTSPFRQTQGGHKTWLGTTAVEKVLTHPSPFLLNTKERFYFPCVTKLGDSKAVLL